MKPRLPLLPLCAALLLACGAAPDRSAAVAPAPPPVVVDAGPAPVASAERDAAVENAQAPAPAAEPLQAVPPKVRVLDPGAAPRRALRYKFKAGAVEWLEEDLKMAMSLSAEGHAAPRVDMPSVRMWMRVEANDVTPEGDVRGAFRAEKVEVLRDVQVDDKLRAALEGELGKLVGTHGTARVTARGVASDVEFDLPAGASDTVRGHLETLRDAIRQMYVPLPEEEVGKGAKWEVVARVPFSGAMMDTKYVYTLVAQKGDVTDTTVETELSAPADQRMALPHMPPGTNAVLEALSGTGSGKVSFPLSHLVGAGQMRASVDGRFHVSAQNQDVRMTLQTNVEVAMRRVNGPGPAAAKK